MNGRVLVVGAGLGGLATARALAGHGIECRVVERRPDRSDHGLALNLPGNAVAALQCLGAAAGVLEAGVHIARREYRTAGGRLLFAVDEGAFWSDVAPSVCAPHAVVVDALSAGVAVEWGVGATSVDQQPDGHVRVSLPDGSEEVADFVVASDGVHSTVRSSMTNASPRPSAMTNASWRFVTDDPGISCWTAWTGTGTRSCSSRSLRGTCTATPPAAAVAMLAKTRPGSRTRTLAFPSLSLKRSVAPCRPMSRRTARPSRRSGCRSGTTMPSC